MIGGDFNTNIDGDIFRDIGSIKEQNKGENTITKSKVDFFNNCITGYDLNDTYWHKKNKG